MLNIYSASIEITFAPLSARDPFDDPSLREDLRCRLNEAPGIDIPASKLELYPNFPSSVLVNPAAWDMVIASLDWFADTVKRSSEQRD
jgi:hypothetical protein